VPRLASASRSAALVLVAAVYAVSAGAAALAMHGLSSDVELVWRLGAASLAATLAVFAWSVALDNSSAFDPYWSVAPMATVAWLVARTHHGGARAWLVALLVWAWGARLTWNWIRQWRGPEHEDFRYVELRRQSGAAYWLVSLFGIHLFPAVLVWLGSFSIVAAMTRPAALGALDLAGVVVAAGATLIEAVADRQLRAFVTSPREPGAICERGLWSWSRHPNYFGELMFWWGIFLLALGADRHALWCIVGPVAITLLFNVVSIPMMEKHLAASRPGFPAHRKRVSRLVPRPPGGRA
jgi:steroid 5-alpha reductase family enzyme